ncbi:hypothetical protein K8352_18515 [Flavobacteriaceae bacterium F89]|uniref:Uncharacterized protein n=1 Tax=Cerina litoralis TaxID=2874477 RepID=A0AAE3JSQ2_9FLAO|nr:hypothetical protein [Cerina litoralis]MCG2462763.1 hypothetical protein [Cerina litoralis]
MDATTLNKIIAGSKPLGFGDIMSRSFDLFKKVWLQGFLTLILTFVCLVPFYLLLYIPLVFMGISDPDMLGKDKMSTPAIIWMAVFLPIIVMAAMVVSIAFTSAFLRICKQKDSGATGADDYFFFFKGRYFGKMIVLGLIAFGLSIIGALLCGVGLLYLIVPLSLIPAFFAFRPEMSPMEIVKAGFQLGNKNWLVIFGLIIVMGIVAELGIILCGIGILFTAMLSKIPLYFIYKDGVGFNGQNVPLEE